jgi:hypothetical protein
MIVGIGTQFLYSFFVNMQNVNIFDAEFVSLFYKTLPVNLSLFGFFLRLFCTISDLIYCFNKTSTFEKKLYNF